MSNRLEREFPDTRWQAVPPPIGPDGLQHYLERGRQLRAEAMRDALRRAAAGVRRVGWHVLNFVRCAGYGLAKRPPQGHYRLDKPALTGDCR
jgi:hypothetical protein